MYIDFHTHGKLAKKLPFSIEYTDWLLKEANSAGLDAICLTEHFNTLQFDELYRYLMKKCKREGDTLVTAEGLRIFAGMETDIAEGGHILTIGTPETILELNARLDPYKEKGKFLLFASLMELFAEYHVMIGAAHPYRVGSHIHDIPIDMLKNLSFLDLNGKDVAKDREYFEEKTRELAQKLNIPMISGSDTHQAVQYGCVRTKFEHDIKTVNELYEEMKKGNYEILISSNASFQVKTAGILKKSLKEIYALGGDYVSVLVNQNND